LIRQLKNNTDILLQQSTHNQKSPTKNDELDRLCCCTDTALLSDQTPGKPGGSKLAEALREWTETQIEAAAGETAA
jgi:hypothetical protein